MDELPGTAQLQSAMLGEEARQPRVQQRDELRCRRFVAAIFADSRLQAANHDGLQRVLEIGHHSTSKGGGSSVVVSNVTASDSPDREVGSLRARAVLSRERGAGMRLSVASTS